MSLTADERNQMCDTFAAVGPDAPTLCTGWTARDLLAHLLVRERRPDAAAGIFISALAPRTKRIMDQYGRKPWDAMIDEWRAGAPMWSFSALPVVGDSMNLFEYFIHHEDVRRAQAHWEPRPENKALDDAIFGRLRLGARLMFRKSPVGVVLRSTGRDDIVARKSSTSVVLVGLPSEIALVGYGRPLDVARVVIQGDAGDIASFGGAKRSF